MIFIYLLYFSTLSSFSEILSKFNYSLINCLLFSLLIWSLHSYNIDKSQFGRYLVASLSRKITSKIIRPLCGRIARAKHEWYPKLEDLNSISIRISCLRFYLRGWIGKKRPIIQLTQRATVISIELYSTWCECDRK